MVRAAPGLRHLMVIAMEAARKGCILGQEHREPDVTRLTPLRTTEWSQDSQSPPEITPRWPQDLLPDRTSPNPSSPHNTTTESKPPIPHSFWARS